MQRMRYIIAFYGGRLDGLKRMTSAPLPRSYKKPEGEYIRDRKLDKDGVRAFSIKRVDPCENIE